MNPSLEKNGYSFDEYLLAGALILILSSQLFAVLRLNDIACPWLVAVIPMTLSYSLFSLVLYRQFLW